jgi:hypothetical protein
MNAETFADLAFAVLIALWAAGVGLWILRRITTLPDDPTDTISLAIPLGLGSLALATLGLAEAAVLDRFRLALVLSLGAIPWVGLIWRRARRALRKNNPARGHIPRSDLTSLDLCLVFGVIGTLLTSLAPVTDGDALCYHLQVPKIFLARHAAVFEPDLHETVYPLVTEMLYAVALAFRGPVTCRVVQWIFGLILAANVTALARPTLGSRARWAGTIALLVPAVSNGMGAPLNDVALAAFGTSALHALQRWWDRPTLGQAILGGILAGFTLGVKYPALVWTGLLGSVMAGVAITKIVRSVRSARSSACHSANGVAPEHAERTPDCSGVIAPRIGLDTPEHRKRTLRHFAAFVFVAAIVGGGWYLRAYKHTGNPVYPFFRRTFGAGIADVLDPIKRPMPVNPINLATALGPMTLEPDRFDSLSHQFGPIFLLFLPGLFLFRPPARVVGIVGFGYVFLMLCLTQRQSMRFLLLAVGPMAVGVAWLASVWQDRGTRLARVLVGLLSLTLACEACLAVGRARHGIRVVLGIERSDEFLARREPTFRVGQWIDANLEPSARILGQDHRGYYIPREYTMELAHRRRTRLGLRGESAEEIVDHLRGEGFTHLLLCPPIPESAVEFDPTLSRLMKPWLDFEKPLFRQEITDADGVVRDYALYALSPRLRMTSATRFNGRTSFHDASPPRAKR